MEAEKIISMGNVFKYNYRLPSKSLNGEESQMLLTMAAVVFRLPEDVEVLYEDIIEFKQNTITNARLRVFCFLFCG